MPSASDEIRAAIVSAGGAIRFDEFMRIALYGELGFYAIGGRAGRRGDFITSPEVGPLFGAVLARWIDCEFRRLGEPDDFVVVECGAGPGTLARSVLTAAPQWRDRYYAVEVSERQRRQHPNGVVSLSEPPAGSFCGVVIANELLDNIPFRLVVFDGGWREVAVSARRGTGFDEILVAVDAAWDWLPEAVPHGTRLPIEDHAASWVSQARRLLRSGAVVVFDYCVASTRELVGRPWRDWLRTYQVHQRGEHYLVDPGVQDITVQVCVDQLPQPTTIESQVEFLHRWGIEDLVDEGVRAWTAAASHPDVHALSMRSRKSEGEALLDPSGLGGFDALTWRIGE